MPSITGILNHFLWNFITIVCSFAGVHAAVAGPSLESHSIEHDGRNRSYLLYTPPSDTPLPLVLVFHGGYGSPDQMARTTRMHDLAANQGFIVAYPSAIVPERHWNDGRDVLVPDVDDVGFVDAVIADVRAQHAVDGDRIYATGSSNGGMFTLRLACERGDVIRAFAPVIANFSVGFVDDCQPVRPLPIAFFQGTADVLMPYGGGTIGGEAGAGEERGEVISAEETFEFWAANNACRPTPDSVMLPDRARYDGTRVERLTYAECADDCAVVQYRVEAGGHAWPGTAVPSQLPEAGLTSRDISATKEIWNFFKAH